MKISVALCTYNGERHIKEQLDSILNQTVSVDEIIICDDLSTDTTLKILEQYKTKHPDFIKVFINDTSLKSVKNFEKAISLCSGDYTFLCDQDDYWHPSKVATFTQYLNKFPDVKVFCSNGYLMDENSQLKQDYFSKWDVCEKFIRQNKFLDMFNFIIQKGNFSTGATMFVNTKFAQSTFPIPILENFHHDEWLAMIAAANDSILFIPKKLINYRIHSSQQVGGVAYQQNSEYFTQIYDYFQSNLMDNDFKSIKGRIKSQINWHNIFLINFKTNPVQYQFLKKIFFKELQKNRDLLKRKAPIKNSILNFLDKIFNKRQLKN